MKTLNNYISERLNPRNLGLADTLPEVLKEKYKLIYNPGTRRYDSKGNVGVEEDLIDETGHFICNFGVVKGRFSCGSCKKLTSLKGAPIEVGKDFNCSRCENLESLKGAPKKVTGDFHCNMCSDLESLEGAPKEVGGDFNCYNCKNLKTLKGAPEKVGRDFICSECRNLESLEEAPKEVDGNFYCYGCSKLKDYNINTKIDGIFIK